MSYDQEAQEISVLFLAEAAEFVDQAEVCLLAIEKNRDDTEALDTLFRVMHNLKGGAKSFGFNEFSTLAHHMESLLVDVRAGKIPMSTDVLGLLLRCCDGLRTDLTLLQANPKADLDHQDFYLQLERAMECQPSLGGDANPDDSSPEVSESAPSRSNSSGGSGGERSGGGGGSAGNKGNESVRISLQKIEDLLNNFGEQVILQAALDHIKFDLTRNQDVAIKTINQLSKLTYDLQQTTIALRMVSLRQLFSKLERTARDTGVATSKKIYFTSEGQENEIDKSIADAIFDPLNHMIRNAVDHGLESEEDRKANGKDPIGKVSLRGFRRGGFFFIEIEDDGRGLDKEKIYRNAVKNGIIQPGTVLSESETYELIYANGLSTRDVANDLSGRGVGMNVVKESIRNLKGSCQIHSKLGEGTRFTIRLPLSLAIFNGMVVRVAESLYIIPNSDVERVLACPSEATRIVSESNDRVIDIGGSVMPLVDLRDQLRAGTKPISSSRKSAVDGTLVVTQSGNGRTAVLVDEIVAQQRIVHKSLGREVNQMRGVTGATILGDGRAALILDVSAWLTARTGAA